MLTSLLLLSLTVFSQTDTTNQVKCFPIPTVKKIMKDLLSGDEAKAQLKLTEDQLHQTEQKVVLKERVKGKFRSILGTGAIAILTFFLITK